MLLDNSLQQTIFRLKITTQVFPLTCWKFRCTSAIERPNAKRELQETNIRLGDSTVNINNLQGSFFSWLVCNDNEVFRPLCTFREFGL